jgi:hypothetical protein
MLHGRVGRVDGRGWQTRFRRYLGIQGYGDTGPLRQSSPPENRVAARRHVRFARATHHRSLARSLARLSMPPRRRILHHIKLNHDSQRPEALAKNFLLLSEVNANIESVQRLYLDIERDYISFMADNVSKSAGKQTS